MGVVVGETRRLLACLDRLLEGDRVNSGRPAKASGRLQELLDDVFENSTREQGEAMVLHASEGSGQVAGQYSSRSICSLETG